MGNIHDDVHLGDTPHNLAESENIWLTRQRGFQVKDVLFEPVRKTQDAMFFFRNPDDMWIPCGPKQQSAVQTTIQDLAAKGLASKILPPPSLNMGFTKEFGEEG
ncbi:hypothetical protein glysoja_046983 [Glycine soja]|uniref:Uncharacterized protein n=1 Tax=Glycine soja TaxID=3848 RepID=A0A0B2SDN3_GLYSO|nr:hypothetical protein glysoja_046983 [Glycine soja]